MFIYVDESGCPGMKLTAGSYPQFTLTAVVFADQDRARAARHQLTEMQTRLRCGAEFKFNRTDKDRRARFFEAIVALDFTYHSFTLNKAALVAGALNESKKLYGKVVGWTFENILDTLAGPGGPERASIVFDSCGDREFYDAFERRIKALVRLKLKRDIPVRVVATDSKSEPLLQLADMVCGAVGAMRSGKKDAATHLRLISAKRRTSRSWP